MPNYFIKRFTIVKATAVSHKGKIRKNNEDYYRIVLPSSKNRLKESIFVLADGMGGHNKGDVASKLAVHSFIDAYIHSEEKRLVTKILNALLSANKSVYARSMKDSRYAGMGTTITLVVIYNDLAVIGNVGDSRVYLFRDAHLTQLSEDHSWVKEIGLSDEEARKHPKRNVITRTIGKNPEVTPYLQTIPLHKGDIFLLCSDGLTTHVADQNIQKILESNVSLKDKQRLLLKLALEGGGTDNISIILAQAIKIKSSKKSPKKRRILGVLFLFFFILSIVVGYWSYKESNILDLFFYSDSLNTHGSSPADTNNQNDISKIVTTDTTETEIESTPIQQKTNKKDNEQRQ